MTWRYDGRDLSQDSLRAKDANLVGQVVGPYRVIARVGHGGSATVYRASQAEEPTEVALKISHPRIAGKRHASQRFLREVQAIRRLEHPGCVRILDWGVHDERIYIAMEFVDAKDLSVVLAEEGAFSQRKAVSIAIAACEVLEAAHTLGVIHRDMKPRNIKLLAPDADDNERIKVVDFGLAKLFEPPTDDDDDEGDELTHVETLTDAETMLGTPMYMAPEQVGGGHVDGRSDLYSLGVILYRMLTGRLPHQGDDAVTWILNMATAEIVSPRELVPEINPQLDALVMRCMRTDPNQRFASAASLSRELRLVLADLDDVAQDKPTNVYTPEALQQAIKDALVHANTDNTTNVLDPDARPFDDTLPSPGTTRKRRRRTSEDSVTKEAPARRRLARASADEEEEDEPPTKTQKTRVYTRKKPAAGGVALEARILAPKAPPRRKRAPRAPIDEPSSVGLGDDSTNSRLTEYDVARRRHELWLLVVALIVLIGVLVWRQT